MAHHNIKIISLMTKFRKCQKTIFVERFFRGKNSLFEFFTWIYFHFGKKKLEEECVEAKLQTENFVVLII